MLVAVITPYHDQASAWLKRCIQSVGQQTYANCIHILVGDGCSVDDVCSSETVHKLNLSHNIGDYGDSPRSLGAIYAFSQGADAVAFLDSDNWYEPSHIETLLMHQQQTGAQVITSYRFLAELNGEVMGVCPDSNGVTFCDTNCMLFMTSAREVAASWWTIPDALHAIDDRVIWDRVLSAQYTIACTRKPTVFYRTGFMHHYRMFGRVPPSGAKVGNEIGRLTGVMTQLRSRAADRASALLRE